MIRDRIPGGSPPDQRTAKPPSLPAGPSCCHSSGEPATAASPKARRGRRRPDAVHDRSRDRNRAGGPASRITRAILDARQDGRAAVIPYFMLGYPTLPESVACVRAAMDAGADLIEVGIPFSDPLADGPVIQHAGQVALDAHTTPQACIAAISTLTGPGTPPIVLMTYFNLLLSRGLARTLSALRAAGLSGLIIPDLSLEALEGWKRDLDDSGLERVHLVAPTSTPERVRALAEDSRGFLYLVSVTGVTGVRRGSNPDLERFVRRVRARAGDLPLCVGFGISGPQQAREVARIADGVIVGSALVEVIRDAPKRARAAAAGRFVRALVRAARRERR